jgi:phosphoribosylformylglycinamidine (FGAM) synthase-like amidotransferase family enzyme
LMPHPERAMQSFLGGTDGYYILESFIKSCSDYNKTQGILL